MNTSTPLTALLDEARRLYAAHRFPEAAAAISKVLAVDPRHREALELSVMLALQGGDADGAIRALQALTSACPGEPVYTDRLAGLLERRQRRAEALECYRKLLEARPELVVSRFNYAGLLRRAGQAEAALAEYRRCLEEGIDGSAEVLSNMGSILADLHRHDEAEKLLTRALAGKPDYLPALYNLALLRQEQGAAEAAAELLNRMLSLQPGHPDALARLAESAGSAEQSRDLLGRVEQALGDPQLQAIDRESLAYARGKLLDDLGRFGDAFRSYTEGSRLSQQRVGPYRRDAQSALVDSLVAAYDQREGRGVVPVSNEPLVFICGMFRSGSTLLEQMLGSHPDLTAGGEIDFFQRGAPLDAVAAPGDPEGWQRLGAGYLDYLQEVFGTLAVTNKRPDNFLYLGLLHQLFPNARFLHTRRQPADNCLSVFFQQLDGRFPYANDLLDVGHYLEQQQRLMNAWEERFGDRIHPVDYEWLVTAPRDTLVPALQFLDLPWDERCLDYRGLENRVRTASVAQVREPLHRRSCDRWRNYARQLQPLLDYLGSKPDADGVG